MEPAESAIASLLNSTRPALRDGWESRHTGVGEVSVGLPALGRFAVLPEEAGPLLELLDGSHTLNEVAGKVLDQVGRVRHHLILDTVVRLWRAGLLAPLDPGVESYLAREPLPKASRSLAARLAALGLMVPLQSSPSRAAGDRTDSTRQAKTGGALFGLAIAVYVALLAVAASRNGGAGPPGGLFGPHPLAGLALAIGGAATAFSLRELVRTAMLLLLGRRVHGVGLKASLGIPHLGVDARVGVMLSRAERMLYRSTCLAAMVGLLALLEVLVALAGVPSAAVFGLGVHAALLVNLSPLWPGDLSHFLEEALEYRRLRRRSGRFLMRKIWRHVVRRDRIGHEVRAMTAFATAGMVYLFLSAALLAWVVPATLDPLTRAILSPASTTGRLVFAAAFAGYLALLFVFTVVMIVAMVVGLMAQLAPKKQFEARPAEVVPATSLGMDGLVDELRAIPPFSSLPPELVRDTLCHGHVETYRAGSEIIRQGEPGNRCFVIRSGRCRVLAEDAAGEQHEEARLGSGHLFGEVALLTNDARTATVVAETDIELTAIDGPAFLELVDRGDFDKDQITERIRIHLFLQRVDLLRGLSAEGLAALTKVVGIRHAQAGTEIVRQGEEGNSLFLVYRGKCQVATEERTVATLEAGDYFGEIALVTGATRGATVATLTDTVLVELPAKAYQDVIAREFATGVLLDREIEQRLADLWAH